MPGCVVPPPEPAGLQPHGHIPHVLPMIFPFTVKSHVAFLHACWQATSVGVAFAAAQPIAQEGS